MHAQHTNTTRHKEATANRTHKRQRAQRSERDDGPYRNEESSGGIADRWARQEEKGDNGEGQRSSDVQLG